jgi:hypothetical protein
MPAASATDGHAMRTWQQATARSVCEPALKANCASGCCTPTSEKKRTVTAFYVGFETKQATSSESVQESRCCH